MGLSSSETMEGGAPRDGVEGSPVELLRQVKEHIENYEGVLERSSSKLLQLSNALGERPRRPQHLSCNGVSDL